MTKLTFSIGDYPKAVETIINGGASNFPGFVIINGPKRAWELYNATGGKRIIVVRSTNADEVLKGSEDKDQRQVAALWADVIRPFLNECPPGCYVTVGHEPGVATEAECRRFDELACNMMGHLQAHNLGKPYEAHVRPALGNFSVGTPPLRKWDAINGYQYMMRSMTMCADMGGALALHQYWKHRAWVMGAWWPDFLLDDATLMLRHKSVLLESGDYIPANLRIIITECGYAPGDPQGWRGHIEQENFWLSLSNFNMLLNAEPRVIMAALFEWEAWLDGWANWNSFSPEGYVADQMILNAQKFPATGKFPPPPAPPPAPEPGPEETAPYGAVVSTGGDNLMLRAGKSTRSTILAKMPPGAEVEVLYNEEGWSRVRYTLEGWASSQYLKRRE